MIKREQVRINNEKISRFEKGDLQKLKKIKNKLKLYNSNLGIYIVQPGVSKKQISSEM